jgi:2-C-methyl-D-erythritol 4-phosphate cytidylyltransferase/2-C-methyl-D-erythritol 2,4-cyclodiphosphate synthase
MNDGGNKVLRPLAGKPIIRWSAERFQGILGVEKIAIIVLREEFPLFDKAFPGKKERAGILPWIEGGNTRRESVWNGLQVLATGDGDPPDHVLVHDGARPFSGSGVIQRVLDALRHHQAVIPVLPVTDTVRQIDEGSSRVLDRSRLFLAQTPQGFHWETLYEGHREGAKRGSDATDDGQLVEALGVTPAYVEGEVDNFKITTETDFERAEWMASRHRPDHAKEG